METPKPNFKPLDWIVRIKEDKVNLKKDIEEMKEKLDDLKEEKISLDEYDDAIRIQEIKETTLGIFESLRKKEQELEEINKKLEASQN